MGKKTVGGKGQREGRSGKREGRVREEREPEFPFGRRLLRLGSLDACFFDLVEECFVAHAEQLGRLAAVSNHPSQTVRKEGGGGGCSSFPWDIGKPGAPLCGRAGASPGGFLSPV